MNISPELIELITRAIFALLALGCLWFFGHVKNALQAKVEQGQASELDILIKEFVAAAEQTLKEKDPTGKLRKRYVEECLTEIGIVITNEINARIEAAVYELNQKERG